MQYLLHSSHPVLNKIETEIRSIAIKLKESFLFQIGKTFCDLLKVSSFVEVL